MPEIILGIPSIIQDISPKSRDSSKVGGTYRGIHRVWVPGIY